MNSKKKRNVIVVQVPDHLYWAIDTAPIKNKSEVVRRCIEHCLERSPEALERGKKATYM